MQLKRLLDIFLHIYLLQMNALYLFGIWCNLILPEHLHLLVHLSVLEFRVVFNRPEVV